MSGKPRCGPEHYAPTPLGTIQACGCIVRAVFVACKGCPNAEWFMVPTHVEVGGRIRTRGLCPNCGTVSENSPVVYRQPPMTPEKAS